MSTWPSGSCCWKLLDPEAYARGSNEKHWLKVQTDSVGLRLVVLDYVASVG